MPLYTWQPIPTFVARQINTLADLDAWIEEVADAGLLGPKDGRTLSDLRGSEIDQDQFWFDYTEVTEVDGSQEIRERVQYGDYAIANSIYSMNRPWFEDELNFGRRFQPYPITE